jgi:hypothetical protein
MSYFRLDVSSSSSGVAQAEGHGRWGEHVARSSGLHRARMRGDEAVEHRATRWAERQREGFSLGESSIELDTDDADASIKGFPWAATQRLDGLRLSREVAAECLPLRPTDITPPCPPCQDSRADRDLLLDAVTGIGCNGLVHSASGPAPPIPDAQQTALVSRRRNLECSCLSRCRAVPNFNSGDHGLNVSANAKGLMVQLTELAQRFSKHPDSTSFWISFWEFRTAKLEAEPCLHYCLCESYQASITSWLLHLRLCKLSSLHEQAEQS